MVTKVSTISAFIAFCVATGVWANDDQIFHIESDRIKEIAFEAASAQYPDISADDLLDEDHFVVWCMSAMKLQIVTDPADDFDICHASVSFVLSDSTVTSKYFDEDGHCYVETAHERIKVKVYSDERTEVGPVGIGSGRVQQECSEEFEGWSE